MSAELRLVGEPKMDVDIFDEVSDPDDNDADPVARWRREPLERAGVCQPCQRTTTMGIRYLPDGPTGQVLPRCLRCWLTGVFQDRGISMHLVDTALYPPTVRRTRDPFHVAVDALVAALVSSISAVDARQGQVVATSRRIRRHAEEAVLEGVTPSSIARRWAQEKVTKVWAGVELAELILDRAMSGRAAMQRRTSTKPDSGTASSSTASDSTPA